MFSIQCYLKRLRTSVKLGSIIHHVLFNFVLTLYERFVKKYKSRVIKNMRFSVYKEKCNLKEKLSFKRKIWNCVTKVKLVTKI